MLTAITCEVNRPMIHCELTHLARTPIDVNRAYTRDTAALKHLDVPGLRGKWAPLIILTHGYTDSNKGDVAITLGTVEALRAAIPEANIRSHSIFSEKHVNFKFHSRLVTRAGIPVVEGILPSPYLDDQDSGSLQSFRAFLRLGYEVFCLAILCLWPGLAPLHPAKSRALNDLKQADLVIARGGQYLHNESGTIRGLLYLARMLLNISVPVWLKKPTVILGLSIGPLHGSLARWLLQTTIRPCQAIIVRETKSADYLRTLGISHNVSVVPDLGFLTVPSKPAAYSLFNLRYLAVSLINWSFPGHKQPQLALANYLEAVFETIAACHTRYNLIPVLVMQVTAEHHGQSDQPVIESMLARIRTAGIPVELISDDLTPGELSSLYGRCEVVLASRLHSVILAACSGVPSVAIHYQGLKTQGIMQDLGLERHTHDIVNVTSAALLRSIAEILTRRESLSTDLQDRVRRFRDRIHVVTSEVVSLIRPAEPDPI